MNQHLPNVKQWTLRLQTILGINHIAGGRRCRRVTAADDDVLGAGDLLMTTADESTTAAADAAVLHIQFW